MKLLDRGKFRSGDQAPHDLGKSFWGLTFTIIAISEENVTIRIYDPHKRRRMVRTISKEALYYYTEYQMGELRPINKISKFVFNEVYKNN